MANRYWVGGAGNWSSTAKWSTSSGGASGASVPTSADDVIFDANSGGKFTATVDTAQSVNSITITPSAVVGVQQIALSARLTTGNLTTTGTAGNNRIWIRGNTYGIAQDFVVNGTVSISDCDFRDIYVIGTAAPISGTRIGDLRGIRGITASTPKTVYWNLAGTQNWSATGWAATSGGSPSTDNFPLAQDTAVFNNAGSLTQIVLDAAIGYVPTVDCSTRTNAMTISFFTSTVCYGNVTLGSGVTTSSNGVFTFSGRNTQTITSAGKTLNCVMTIDSYGGTVQLADALNINTLTLTVTNGTFDTQNYNVTAGILSSSNSNVRAINLGSSTLTLSNTVVMSTPTNLTLNAGTSTIAISSSGSTFQGSTTLGLSFYNVSFTSTTATVSNTILSGTFTFNNLSFAAPSSAGLIPVSFAATQTITGTLTVSGATAVRRIFLRSSVLGTQRDLTVGTLVADDCDFRDIEILGGAIGTAPTRAGDCGGNNNITFPSPKTVYWNLAGSQAWGATAWATSSGGTPDINNYPLPQDTAVLDDTGSITGTITITSGAYQIGTLDMSGRTSAATLAVNAVSVYGNFTFGSGITTSGTQAITFCGRGTQTITSAGKSFTNDITIDSFSGAVQLADALTLGSARTLTLTSGTFDAVTYNVTTGAYATNGASSTLKMGSGTWTLSGTGTVWNMSSNPVFYKGTANIVLSDTSATARTFGASGLSYNKLTIGGATGSSTLTFSGSPQFTELASTKTVAHTIALGTTTQTFGAWTVTGTAGNVVTVTGTAALTIAGARVSGVDYLAMGTTTVSATSPGEFYSGANSTGTGTGIIKTAAPAAVTRYWRGGTGTWDATTTTNWSATSGGAGGASVPTSADAVVFDSLSNATAYTVTCTATQLRCGSLTMAGPLTGNVTWAGTAPLAIHDNVTLPATGLTRSYTGAITLSGSATGKTLTTNGVTLASTVTVNGVGCEWALGSALTNTNLGLVNGAFNTGGYAVSATQLTTSAKNTRSLSLGSSTLTFSNTFALNDLNSLDFSGTLSFDAGTSTINVSNSGASIGFNGETVNNFAFTSTATGIHNIFGSGVFTNLTVAGSISAGLRELQLKANQTINGTLTLSAGTNATMRTFVRSDTIGTTRTLTCAAVTATDIDFRDITIAGAAAPVSGTRLGDCKGNSGITFGAAKTVYYRSTSGNWGATTWAFTNGGTADITAFPLAQDTAVFPSSPTPYPSSGATCTSTVSYNIGTIDMSARTSNTMTLATSTSTPAIYGNWINGTGTTLTGTGVMTFAGRGSQTITSAGKTFTQPFTVDTPGGEVSLQDSLITSNNITLNAGTLNATTYNVTMSGASAAFLGNAATPKTIAVGSGIWTLAGSSVAWNAGTSAATTVTGTGTISLTSASPKQFTGGSISYSGITLNQGGAGTLTITGNNTFANISNTYKATGATTIAMGTTIQTVANFTASGEAGRVLTVQGTSAASPATLVLTGGTVTTPDYLAVTGVRAYSLVDTWYAGANSTNNGSLGWYFSAGIAPIVSYLGNFFAFF